MLASKLLQLCKARRIHVVVDSACNQVAGNITIFSTGGSNSFETNQAVAFVARFNNSENILDAKYFCASLNLSFLSAGTLTCSNGQFPEQGGQNEPSWDFAPILCMKCLWHIPRDFD